METPYTERKFIDNEWLAYLRTADISYRLPDGQLPVVCSGKKGKGIKEYGGRWQI